MTLASTQTYACRLSALALCTATPPCKIRFALIWVDGGHSRAPDDAWATLRLESRSRCLGVAADVGPRLAERVAEAVREATTL